MAQPPPYEIATHFGLEKYDTEFNNLKETIDSILANLALIQRDDGKIKDGTGESHIFNLDPEMVGFIQYVSGTWSFLPDPLDPARTAQAAAEIAQAAAEIAQAAAEAANVLANQYKDEAENAKLAAETAQAAAEFAQFSIPTSDNVQLGSLWYALSTGTSTAYQLTLTPVPASLNAGFFVHMKAHATNTGPATLDVNSIGVKIIKTGEGNDLKTEDIKINSIYRLIYDGTNFILPIASSKIQENIDLNASNTFRAFEEIQENHGGALLMETGWSDSFSNANEQGADEANSSGFQHDNFNKLYKGADGGAGLNSDKNYTTESNYLQQEWTNSLLSTGQASVINGSATITLSAGTWPTNCEKGRISFDGGSAWYNIETRASGTSIELDSTATETTNSYDYVIRMSEFDSGVVQLNGGGGESVNLAPGNTFAASSEFNYTYAVEELFDGITAGDNGWLTQNNDLNGAWASVDFGSAKIINKIRVFQRGYSGQRTVSQFKVQCSADNTTWNDLTPDAVVEGTVTISGVHINYTISEHDVFQGVTLTNSTAYRYYRVYITGNIADGDGPYVGFGEVEFHGVIGSNATNEFVSICDTEVQKTDTSSWSDINSSSASETLNSQSIYHWLAFDPASSFGAGTEIKIFNPTDNVWRVIAKNNAGTWEYNNDSGNSATYIGANATVNDMLHAISEAISTQSGNRMTGANLAAITDTQWEESEGWSTSINSIIRGFTLYSNSSSQNPSVSQYRINYDSGRSSMDLRSKTYDPGFAPTEAYIWCRAEHSDVDGSGTFSISRNGGIEWTTVSMAQQGEPLTGDVRILRGTIDISGQTSGQDLRCRYQTTSGKDQFLHSWGVQAKP